MPCSSDQEQFYRHKDTLLADPLSLGQFFCVFAVVNHWNMFQVETALTQKKELDVKKKTARRHSSVFAAIRHLAAIILWE